MIQPGKSLIYEKKPEIFLEGFLKGFLELAKKFIRLMGYLLVYIMHHSCIYDSEKTACFGKISLSSCKRKQSRPIRWQAIFSFNKYHKKYLRYKVPFCESSEVFMDFAV